MFTAKKLNNAILQKNTVGNITQCSGEVFSNTKLIRYSVPAVKILIPTRGSSIENLYFLNRTTEDKVFSIYIYIYVHTVL
jgi:hypothetical protein